MNTARLGVAVGIFLASGLAVAVLASPLASRKGSVVQVQVQATLDGAGSGIKETNLGDLVADAVRQTGGADLALVPADEIGDSSVPAGSVPVSTLVHTLHYADDASDTVVVLNLTGAQIMKAVERGVSRNPQAFNGFLQVSGIQVHYDANAPEGKRVGLVETGGGAISPSKTYKVATTRTIADGGLGYFQIWDKGDVGSNTNISVADSLTSYLTSHKTISGSLDGRITTGH